ncbi:hypothetical protein DKX38_011214 [Salix brachista]|uniref:Uncharacterized protein n=1 Tax=Salix brachista TaxID=2182728 RepID=A0A5N5LYU6_9ROSI|nr:hypothetical protein DKX38_011214 [Salix brachista]
MEPDLLALVVGMSGSTHCRCLVSRAGATVSLWMTKATMHCQLERLFQGQDRPPPSPSSLDKIGCLPLHVLEGRSDECKQTVEISRDRIKVQGRISDEEEEVVASKTDQGVDLTNF